MQWHPTIRKMTTTARISSVTRIPAVTDCIKVMTITRQPVFLSRSSLKNLPTPKAMNASAMSLTKLIPEMISGDTAPNRSGPRRIPANIYPVTLGRCNSLVILVNRKPLARITASEIKTTVGVSNCEYN